MLIIIILIVLVGLFFMGAYNKLVSLKNKVMESWSGIDVHVIDLNIRFSRFRGQLPPTWIAPPRIVPFALLIEGLVRSQSDAGRTD